MSGCADRAAHGLNRSGHIRFEPFLMSTAFVEGAVRGHLDFNRLATFTCVFERDRQRRVAPDRPVAIDRI